MVKQFDFLSGYTQATKSSSPEQMLFWDDDYNVVKPVRGGVAYDEANNFFNKLNYKRVPRYVEYW